LREFFSQFELGTEPLWPLVVQEDRSTAQQLFAKILLVGVGFGVLCGVGRFLSETTQHIFTFCAANGVLVAFLLRRTKDHWWMFLMAAWLGDAISMGVGLDYSLTLAASIAFCNVLEAAIAAVLMRRVLARNRDMAAPEVMIKFLLFAVILAPAVSGALGALCYHLANGQSVWMGFEHWYPPMLLAWRLWCHSRSPCEIRT
jgi:integral membrane sensor domain MASE1